MFTPPPPQKKKKKGFRACVITSKCAILVYIVSLINMQLYGNFKNIYGAHVHYSLYKYISNRSRMSYFLTDLNLFCSNKPLFSTKV